jgi:demethylmenaquinone methyltransferase/2-methoxy-6-polyprenyl-1,4-benzoquinol methylase
MGYYDDISEGYEELHREEQLKKVSIIISKLKIRPADKLLDVACGSGLYLDRFKCQVTGLDPAKKLLGKYKGKSEVVLGRAEELPFPDKSFDIITCITAVHNFQDIDKGLSEIRRVGKKMFVLSILKRSPKFGEIERKINELFTIKERIEEDKDIIFFCQEPKRWVGRASISR